MATKTGTAAADLLYGGGPDTLIGLAGDDSYAVYTASDTVVEAPREGNDTVLTFANYALAAGASVETLSTAINAGNDPIALTGNTLSQVIVGNYGSNTLDGGGGGDALAGLRGDDVYRVYGLNDLVVEQANEGNDAILAAGNFVLGAGSSVERIEAADRTSTIGLFLGGNELNQTINGSAGDDVINGGGQTRSGTFHDFLNGGAGNDTYRVFGDNQFNSSNGEVVFELPNEGNDAIYTSGTFFSAAYSSIELLSTASHAGTEAINLVGNGIGQVIIGNYGDNQLLGFNTAGLSDKGPIVGADTLIGLFGDDTYRVFDSNDVVVEQAGQGNDRVFSDFGYALHAGSSVEMLSTSVNSLTNPLRFTGNEIANILIGNFGVNTLDGGGGSDTLIGLNGADAFRFSTALGPGNIDTITDFGLGADTIELDPTVFTGLALGALDASAIAYGAAAADADDRIVYDPSSGALSYDADGSGAGAATRFASLATGLAQAVIQVNVATAPDPGAVQVTFGGTYLVGGAVGPGISLAAAYPQATSFTFGREGRPTTDYSLVFGPNSAGAGPLLGFSFATIDTFDFSQLGVGMTYSGANGFGTATGGQIAFIPRPTPTARTVPETIVATPFADVIDRTDGTNFGDQPFGVVRGGAGNDVLTGGRDLSGDEGNDRLVGVAFTRLTGGTGNDTFVLPIYSPTSGPNTGTLPNIVTDFNPAEDRIELKLNIASDLPAGPLDSSRFAIGAAATTPDQRILYDPSNGVLRYDANGSLPDAPSARPIFAVLPKGLELSAAQFDAILP